MAPFHKDFDAIVLALQKVGCTIIEDLGNGQYRFNYFPLTGIGHILQTALASALLSDATKALTGLGIDGAYMMPTDCKVRATVDYDYGTFVLNFHVKEKVLKVTFASEALTEDL